MNPEDRQAVFDCIECSFKTCECKLDRLKRLVYGLLTVFAM